MLQTIRGRVGAIKWAYFDAASIDGYSVTRGPDGWRATGAFVPGRVDAFKLTRRPLFLVAPFKGGAWRWEIETLTTDGMSFTAALGPLTVEDRHGITRPTARN